MADRETHLAFAASLKPELEEFRIQLEPLESGSMTISRREHGGDWEDITQDHIAFLKHAIGTFEDLIEEHTGIANA